MSPPTFRDRSKRWVSDETAADKMNPAQKYSSQICPKYAQNWDACQFWPQICRPPIECLFVCKASLRWSDCSQVFPNLQSPYIFLVIMFPNLDTFSLHSFNFVKMIQSLIWTNAKSLNLWDQRRDSEAEDVKPLGSPAPPRTYIKESLAQDAHTHKGQNLQMWKFSFHLPPCYNFLLVVGWWHTCDCEPVGGRRQYFDLAITAAWLLRAKSRRLWKLKW